MSRKKFEINMVEGPILPKILLFSIPLILSGILQLMFNAADIAIIGQYSTKKALAAIGSTSSLINLFVNIIIGISIGSNVIVARYIGAKKDKDVHEAVHTSILVGFIFAIIVGIAGFIASKPLLKLMGTPSDVIDLSVLYVRIYFIGLPGLMIYNFGSAILRAIGDTRRPLIILTLSGIVNVGLNIFLVTTFNMSVDGVAIATVVSELLSAIMVVLCLMHATGPYKLNLRELHINRVILLKIFQIGIPAGIQSMIFSISNMLIQSSVNSFGSTAMAGNTVASNIEGFVYTSMNSVYQTTISFVSQNYGAGKIDRLKKIFVRCLIVVSVVGILLGNMAYIFGHFFLSLYRDEAPVIEYGLERLKYISTVYLLCGIMEVCCGMLRGLGYGIMPMIVSLLGACGIRILWIYTYFKSHHELRYLYLSYPISWTITIMAHLICIAIVWNRHFKRRRI